MVQTHRGLDLVQAYFANRTVPTFVQNSILNCSSTNLIVLDDAANSRTERNCDQRRYNPPNTAKPGIAA